MHRQQVQLSQSGGDVVMFSLSRHNPSNKNRGYAGLAMSVCPCVQLCPEDIF